MFVLLFAYVFGGVIDVPGGNYHEFLIGGILVQTLAFGMMGPATSIADRPQRGHRRPLPVAADVALRVPARPRARRARAAIAVAIAVLAPPASSSAGASTPTCSHALARLRPAAAVRGRDDLARHAHRRCIVRTPDAVQGIVFIVVFPLTFLANAFVPPRGLPDGLQTSPSGTRSARSSPPSRTLFGNPTATPADAPGRSSTRCWRPAGADHPRRRGAADDLPLPRRTTD